MPNQIRCYLGCIIALGSLAIVASLAQWQCSDHQRFTIYFLLALLAGALKVRLPGMTGTYSLTFLFVLIGVEDLTLAETLLIACSSMIVQSIWRAERPRAVQVTFNVAAVAISVAIAFPIARSPQIHPFAGDVVVRLSLAAVVYYVTNTLVVSGILALVEAKPLKNIWFQWLRWSFRYYLIGVATAIAFVASSRTVGWTLSLIVLPVMYVEYLWFHVSIRSQQPRPRGPCEAGAAKYLRSR